MEKEGICQNFRRKNRVSEYSVLELQWNPILQQIGSDSTVDERSTDRYLPSGRNSPEPGPQ